MSRDYQRKKLYDWENETFKDRDFKSIQAEKLSLVDCTGLAAKMYGKKVLVKDGRGTRNALAFTTLRKPTISLPRWARHEIIIAHEVAHLLAAREGFDSGHGSRFVGIFIELLEKFCGENADDLEQSAIETGLKILRTTNKPKCED